MDFLAHTHTHTHRPQHATAPLPLQDLTAGIRSVIGSGTGQDWCGHSNLPNHWPAYDALRHELQAPAPRSPVMRVSPGASAARARPMHPLAARPSVPMGGQGLTLVHAAQYNGSRTEQVSPAHVHHPYLPPSLPATPPPPSVQATPMFKQHWALVPSIFALWALAVLFSIGPTVCYVCCLIPPF